VSTGFTDDDKEMLKDHIMMTDGKVMMIKEGKSMPLDKEITLSDGTKVTVDGTVTMKDGKKMMMKEGDMMTMDGEEMKHDAKEHGTKENSYRRGRHCRIQLFGLSVLRRSFAPEIWAVFPGGRVVQCDSVVAACVGQR